jgi:hypothetical protein
MKRTRYEVSYHKRERKWQTKNNGTVIDYSLTKAEAVRYAADAGRQGWERYSVTSELIIKRKDGTIQDKRTYGHDPERIKG